MRQLTSEDHRAGEVREVGLLVLPGASVVAHQMRVGLQARVAVGGQHLAVGVDVDAGVGGGIQDRLEVAEVVAGDEDGLARHGGHPNRGRGGCSEGSGIRSVEQFHDLEVEGAQGQCVIQQRLQVGRRVTEEGQGLFDPGIYLVGAVAKNVRVMGVGAHALESVQVQVADADDVSAEGVDPGVDADLGGLREEFVQCRAGDEGRGTGQRHAAGLLVGLLRLLLQSVRLGDEADEFGRIEVHVRQAW